MVDRSFSMLVHGEAKIGKTSFCATGPVPILFLDAENAAKFVRKQDGTPMGTPFRQIKWDPMKEAVPQYDGTWEMCVVKIDEWRTALKAYEYLKTDRHPFKSVVVDSLTEIQDKLKKDVKPDLGSPMKIQEWGVLLESMGSFCRNLRDLTARDSSPIQFVGLIATSRENKDGKWKPQLQGSLAKDLPYIYDMTAYIDVKQFKDDNNKPYHVRRLWTENHPKYEAGNRTPLPKEIFYPNVQQMLDQLFGPEVDNQPQA